MKTFHSPMSASAIALLSVLSLPSAWAETAQPGSYKIDPDHTSVHFTVNHLGTSELVGRFNQIEGDFTLAPDGESRVEVRIATASVDTNHAKRDDHLRSPDFFNAKQYPEMKFTSRKVDFNDGEPQRIEGELSLHGKTRAVTFNVEAVGAGADPWGGYRAGYNASTVIRRSDYGMDFMQGGIGDDIQVTLNIEAIRQ